MSFTTLISVAELQALQQRGAPLVVFDCSCDLMKPEIGPAQYAESHIAGALYAHLDNNLSAKGDPAVTGALSGGRHPLPSRGKFAAWLSSIGVHNTDQVVVYDRQGANYCGRLWWMLKWLGHAHVAVLDGGFQAWQAAGGAVHRGDEPARAPTTFAVADPLVALRSSDQVLAHLGQPTQHVLDARGAPRFRGEVEPIDPVAGHIPGALNRVFSSNLGADGFFKPAEVLRTEFEALLGSRQPGHVVHHCGSGVSAVPNILAMEIAGLHGSALFAGSWSEWCNRPDCPVAQG
ncbi:sulfurtransferase [Rhodoferax bucti]|uniref:sulfurtransferase n=1 Tax=Rhodoferax bucti TaxID=2576305 RepID=UPI001107B384|nr:sulfurtransferase [Rhodoferax bucti]